MISVGFDSLGHVFLALVIHRVRVLFDPVLDCQFDLSDAHASLKWSQELVGAGIVKVVSVGKLDVGVPFNHSRAQVLITLDYHKLWVVL